MKSTVTKIDEKVFDRIKNNSFRKVESELQNSSKYLSEIFGTEFELSLANEDYALYYSPSANKYLKAKYQITSESVKFDNFEAIEVDKNSIKESKKQILSKMIESIENGNEKEADRAWNEWLNKFSIKEAKQCCFDVGHGDAKINNQKAKPVPGSSVGKTSGKTMVKGDEMLNAAGELAPGIGMPESLNLEILPNYSKALEKLLEASKRMKKKIADDEPEVKITKDEEGSIDSIEVPTEDKEEFEKDTLDDVEELGKKVKKSRGKKPSECPECEEDEMPKKKRNNKEDEDLEDIEDEDDEDEDIEIEKPKRSKRSKKIDLEEED